MSFEPPPVLLDSFPDSIVNALEWLVRLPSLLFDAYSSLLGWAVDEARSLFESYGYWVVFFGTLFENTLFLGAIIPGSLVVILAGLSSQDGTISLPLAFLLGVAGTVIGDTASYLLGRYGWSRIQRLQEPVEKVREPLMRRGTLFVLSYHFAGYTRIVGPTAAGLFRMPMKTWAMADYAGATIWVASYMAIGYALGLAGLTLDSTDNYFRYVEWGLLAVVLVWFFYLYRVGMRMWTAQPPQADSPNVESVEGAVAD